MEATAETEQRCSLQEELGLQPLGMCKFNRVGENEVSSGKAAKMGAKPGQDGKKIKAEGDLFFFQLSPHGQALNRADPPSPARKTASCTAWCEWLASC